MIRIIRMIAIFITFLVVSGLLLYFVFKSGKAYQQPNIYIDAGKVMGPVPKNWKALAQGGEEKGVRMLGNVIPQVSELYPRYIRIDHVFDFYDVVSRDESGKLQLSWNQLDDTVCDIYHTGAKPFFVIGYMSPAISADGSLVSLPTSWDDWKYVVRSLVERYSGKETRICGGVYGDFMNNVYYEVWNEPDLETFGKWSIYGGEKDYKRLYKETVLASISAENVYGFHIGGPATTGMYPNWIRQMLRFCRDNNLRLDYLSWHRYTKDSDQYLHDVTSLNNVLSESEFETYKYIPKIISEWGYDSEPNEKSNSVKGAAHTAMSVHNLIDQNLEMAFAFEIKDGPVPRWGFLTNSGEKTKRYEILRELNRMTGRQIFVSGETTEIRVFATKENNIINIMLVNYSSSGSVSMKVPVTIYGLSSANTVINKTVFVDNEIIKTNENVVINDMKYSVEEILTTDGIIFLSIKEE